MGKSITVGKCTKNTPVCNACVEALHKDLTQTNLSTMRHGLYENTSGKLVTLPRNIFIAQGTYCVKVGRDYYHFECFDKLLPLLKDSYDLVKRKVLVERL